MQFISQHCLGVNRSDTFLSDKDLSVLALLSQPFSWLAYGALGWECACAKLGQTGGLCDAFPSAEVQAVCCTRQIMISKHIHCLRGFPAVISFLSYLLNKIKYLRTKHKKGENWVIYVEIIHLISYTEMYFWGAVWILPLDYFTAISFLT